MSVSFKYEILPFDTPWAGSKSGPLCIYKKNQLREALWFLEACGGQG